MDRYAISSRDYQLHGYRYAVIDLTDDFVMLTTDDLATAVTLKDRLNYDIWIKKYTEVNDHA